MRASICVDICLSVYICWHVNVPACFIFDYDLLIMLPTLYKAEAYIYISLLLPHIF